MRRLPNAPPPQLEKDLVLAVKRAAAAMNVYCEWSGQRNARGAGNTTGLPDCFVYVAGRCIPLELKTATGRLSAAQLDCLIRRERCGVTTHVVRCLDDFVAVVNAARKNGTRTVP